MMAELIDRAALINSLDELKYCYIPETWSDVWVEKPTWYAHEVADIIDNAPAVDAVEVARCKDCRFCKKHPTSDDVKMCTNQEWSTEYYPLVEDDDYCSYGERREDNGST